MIQQDQDYLMNIIKKMVKMILNLMMGRGGRVDEEELQRACETLAGLSIDTAAALSLPSVVRLLTGPEGLDGERSLMLALGFISRGLQMKRSKGDINTRIEGEALLERGQTLLVMALEADSTLVTEPIAQLMERLFEEA